MESGLERVRELEYANEVLRERERMLLGELEGVQQVATQLISARGIEALYEQILDTAVALVHADFASIQMFCSERGENGELRLLGYRGFSAEAAKRWEWVRADSRTSCGEALRIHRRVVVPDVRNCGFMAGSTELETYINTGILAVQTTPLVSRSGALLGMVSTHWREPHQLSPTEASVLDILARLAADLIECSHAEDKLWESENRFQTVADTAPLMIWMTDPNMRCTFVNKAWLEFTGRTLEQELGDGWKTNIHPDDFSICTAALRARSSVRLECRHRLADGKYHWVLCSGEPRLGQDGRLLGY